MAAMREALYSAECLLSLVAAVQTRTLQTGTVYTGSWCRTADSGYFQAPSHTTQAQHGLDLEKFGEALVPLSQPRILKTYILQESKFSRLCRAKVLVSVTKAGKIKT
jgi:hypothetical protein